VHFEVSGTVGRVKYIYIVPQLHKACHKYYTAKVNFQEKPACNVHIHRASLMQCTECELQHPLTDVQEWKQVGRKGEKEGEEGGWREELGEEIGRKGWRLEIHFRADRREIA